MSSLNEVNIIGHLGRDPELKFTPSGQPVANFSVATDESYMGKDGQKIQKTEWHRIVVWGKQAEFCGTYLKKGSLVYVKGSLETRKWTDKDSAEKYTTEIKAIRVQGLGKRPEGQQQTAPQQQSYDENHRFPTEASGLDDAPF